ncbi:MAG TPA: sensor domain-containing diguanylate cyclase [bacterium]|nr:sensor domain-containing diguanylate cyclase [bacterium]HNT65158.1 sensor domain-containing diguanylate cyclase [bacterium]
MADSVITDVDGETELQSLRYRCADLVAANRELHKQQQELQWLLQINRCLSNTLDKNETIDSLKEFFFTNFAWAEFSLLLKSQLGEKLRVAATFGSGLKTGKQFTLNHSDPLFNHIIAHNQPLYIRDLQTVDPLPRFTQLQSGSLLCLPLSVAEDQVIGFVAFGKETRENFSLDEIERLRLLCGHVAIVLHKTMLYQNTKDLAYTDELTAIFNRRYFNQCYEREIGRAKRYQRALSVLMIDIDHFKKLNDTQGHLHGDRVLKQMAQLFDDNIRKADILSRYGGEEFVILLPEIRAKEAVTVAEKLRKRVKSQNFNKGTGPAGGVTISIGVAAFPENGVMAEEVLHKADLALYAAKQGGRNRVVVANSLTND